MVPVGGLPTGTVAGLDPQVTTIFTHSAVPALNQLLLPFLSLVSEAELHRNPTVKAELIASGRALSGLLLTYPVHQAADILFCRGNLVPVGKDNLPHVEITRTIARRFNERYGDVFPEPEALVTDAPELPGLDGRKMSKSYGNAIELGMTADETAAAIRRARTDSDRAITYDPGRRPGVAGLLATAAVVLSRTPDEIADEIGTAGAGALKRFTTEAVNEFLREHRARRSALTADDAAAVLRRGNARADAIATDTLNDVRSAMGMIECSPMRAAGVKSLLGGGPDRCTARHAGRHADLGRHPREGRRHRTRAMPARPRPPDRPGG